MVLDNVSQPDPREEGPEDGEEENETYSILVNFVQYCAAKFYGYASIRKMLPRPTIVVNSGAGSGHVVVRDSLASVLYVTKPDLIPLLKATGVASAAIAACLVPYIAIYYGTRQLVGERIFDTRVVRWSKYTWDDLFNKIVTALTMTLWFPLQTLWPALIAQSRWQGYKGMKDLLTCGLDWRTVVSLSVLNLPTELLDTDEIEKFAYSFFVPPEEEERDFVLEEDLDEEEIAERRAVALKRKLLKTGIHFGVGAMIGLFFLPIDVIVGHVMSGEEKYNTIPKCVHALWEEGGVLAFYRGAVPILTRYVCMLGTLGQIWLK